MLEGWPEAEVHIRCSSHAEDKPQPMATMAPRFVARHKAGSSH